MGAQQAAQAHGQHALVLVVAHGDGDLEVFVGMQSAGIFKVAVAEGACLA
jgi:hypothetical protein